MAKNLNNRDWSLRNKIAVSMVALLLLLGLAIVFITHTILLKTLKKEFQRRGLSLSQSISANSLVDVLTQNTSRIKLLIENEKKLDKDIAYIFILDSTGRLLAHTFDKGLPMGLARVNTVGADNRTNTQLLSTQMGIIYDIAAPISLDKSAIGQVRIGILQSAIQKTITTINLAFIAVTFLIMLIGIFLAYKISALITKPLSKLAEATQLIQKGDFSAKIDVQGNDEIGTLAVAFNEMASRLHEMVDQKKKLTMIEERNRIGLDLHDGCAQDLANIIKRLELCERLFEIEPSKAQQELNTLRENTRDVLNRARQMIFELKSPQGITDFNLYNNLSAFAKDFQKQNGINVKLDTLNSLDNIPLDKSKSILFIVTEAFANIRKHSSAKNIEMILDIKNNNLIINIKDDGKGFDISKAESVDSGYGKWGLIGMRQRAASLGGTFVVKSMLNQGTEISVTIPLENSSLGLRKD